MCVCIGVRVCVYVCVCVCLSHSHSVCGLLHRRRIGLEPADWRMPLLRRATPSASVQACADPSRCFRASYQQAAAMAAHQLLLELLLLVMWPHQSHRRALVVGAVCSAANRSLTCVVTWPLVVDSPLPTQHLQQAVCSAQHAWREGWAGRGATALAPSLSNLSSAPHMLSRSRTQ